ncbi:MAG TPA: hypothetical protein VIJ94_10670 [Caulobacteraceae bacterium]
MRNKILVAVTAAFALSSVGLVPYVAAAQVTPAQMKRDGEKKNPAVADAAIAKDEAKDAKKQDHRAKTYAKVAMHKAKVAHKKAHKAIQEEDRSR